MNIRQISVGELLKFGILAAESPSFVSLLLNDQYTIIFIDLISGNVASARI
jgi:hypothetical protein